MKKSTIAAAIALLVMALAAPTASADTEISYTGLIHGEHRLRDSRDKPGVMCQYARMVAGPPPYIQALRKLTVRPPVMYAAFDTETVGWRFYVERTKIASSGFLPSRTYTSPWQLATATPEQYAPFTAKHINVRLPGNSASGYPIYTYTVYVDMTWLADGESVGEATHRVDFYRSTYRNSTNAPRTDQEPCSSTVTLARP